MHIVKVCVLLLFLTLVECGRGSRQNGVKKETKKKSKTVRGEVFDNLFNVYDPSYLTVVWPKITNGVHILIDHSCWDDMSVLYRDLAEGRAWTYTAQDASGRYGSSLFSGSRFWLGSKQQCFQLDHDSIDNNGTKLRDIYYSAAVPRNKYFDEDAHDWRWTGQEDSPQTTLVDRWAPYRLAYSTVQIVLNITKTNLVKSHTVTLGVCLPRSCSPRDVSSIINFSVMINDNLKTNKTTSRIARVIDVRRVEETYNAVADNGAILLIFITVVLITLVIAATVVDLDLVKCLPYAKKSMTFDLEKYNTEPRRPTEKETNKHDINKANEMEKLGLDKVNYMGFDKCVPTVTLDVNCGERQGNCKRCGKYRKQCSNPRNIENLPPCPRVKYNSIASLSTESKKKSLFCRLLLCFSLAYCWKRVFNTNTATKDLSVIHGMRILATLWVMFLHVAVMVEYISDNAGDINELNNIYYIILTGTIAFDTLFFVSGLFSSHHFFYLKSQYSVKELVGFRGACGQVLQFVCFVTNRVIRLLPSYAYVLLLTRVLARSSQSTATLSLPDGDDRNCANYWWRNLLYVTTVYPSDEQCMQVSWYLSTETQLHALGALLCALSAASSLRARMCSALALVAVLASTVADASASYFDFGQPFTNGFGAYTIIIERPWARLTPYIIGIFSGWLIHIVQGKLKVSKITASLLWVASTSFIFASSAIPLVGLPWLGAWLHLSWPIALLWPVLMCATNFSVVFRRVLATSSVAALSRLCYGMLLLHVAVARTVLLSMDTALCSHTLCIWLYFAGCTLLTLVASLFLSLLVEMPCCSLLRRLSDCAI